jgi:hypothetical protein
MRLSTEYSSSASFIFETAELKEFRSECKILKGFPTKVWFGSAIDIQLKLAPMTNYSDEFKLAATQNVLNGNSINGVARELGIVKRNL